jgi:hypothetical protein
VGIHWTKTMIDDPEQDEEDALEDDSEDDTANA